MTFSGGAPGADKADYSPLIGRHVVVWPDADDPGREAAKKAAAGALAAGAASAKIVSLPPDLPKSWDLADQPPTGMEIAALIATATPFDNTLAKFARTARELANLELPPREYLVEHWLATDSLSMIFATRGIGKTWIGLSLALAIATGTDFLAYTVPREGELLFWDGEMTVSDLKERLQALGASDAENLIVMASELLYREATRVINLNKPEDQNEILRTVQDLGRQGRKPDLIIFDNLSALGGGVDENDKTALDALLKWLISLRHQGYAVMLMGEALRQQNLVRDRNRYMQSNWLRGRRSACLWFAYPSLS